MNFRGSRYVADDGDVAMRIWYTGATVPCALTVAAGGDLSSTIGGSADANFTSSGAASGTIDLSTPAAAYDTYGELARFINSLDDYHCILVDVLPTDSTDNTLLAMSATSVPVRGLNLYKDTSVALNLSIGITSQWKDQDDLGMMNFLDSITSTNTYGSGASTIQVWRVYNDPAKTPEQLFSKAGGATGVEQTIPTYEVFQNLYVEGATLLVRMVGSAVCTGSLSVVGKSKPGPMIT